MVMSVAVANMVRVVPVMDMEHVAARGIITVTRARVNAAAGAAMNVNVTTRGCASAAVAGR
jgi:hypothetical protein